MVDTSHLVTLHERLWHEKGRLNAAKDPKEIEMRKVWVVQVEREIAEERKFLGLSPEEQVEGMEPLSDDELLRELQS